MGSFADAWRTAGEEPDEFDPPNGAYQAVVIDAGAFEGRDGRGWCKVRYRVATGPGTTREHAGREFEDFGAMGDHNPTGMRIMREKLVTLGLVADDVQTIEDLDDALRGIVGVVAELSVGHKDGYRNVRVNGSRTGQSDIPAEPGPAEANGGPRSFAAAAGADPDDVPF